MGLCEEKVELAPLFYINIYADRARKTGKL